MTRGQKYAQLAQRGGVEGARLHPADAELAQPAAQLPRGPGGERHREHLRGQQTPAVTP